MLLVLDNYEQVVLTAPLLAEMVANCPHLKILVTSRARLHVRGEQEYSVAPLATPNLGRRDLHEMPTPYASMALFLKGMAEICASCLLRVKRNRVFYRPAPPRIPGQGGARGPDGARFQCCDESTHGEPDGTWEGTDAKGRRVEVRCWNRLHLRQAREIEVSVVQGIRHGAEGSTRDPQVSWFVWKGEQPAPLAQISPTYRLRYSHEHGFHLDKQVLLWDKPRLRTAEQTASFPQVVACAHNQLVAARPLLEGVYRPWNIGAVW